MTLSSFSGLLSPEQTSSPRRAGVIKGEMMIADPYSLKDGDLVLNPNMRTVYKFRVRVSTSLETRWVLEVGDAVDHFKSSGILVNVPESRMEKYARFVPKPKFPHSKGDVLKSDDGRYFLVISETRIFDLESGYHSSWEWWVEDTNNSLIPIHTLSNRPYSELLA